MDKEKQIVSCETCNHKKVCYDLLTNKDYNFKGYGCLRYCRDLIKDSIVISKEEYERLQSTIKRLRAYDKERDIQLHANLISKTRKETAEKILKELYMHFNSDYLCGLRNPNKDSTAEGFVVRLAKQYGVDLGEEKWVD